MSVCVCVCVCVCLRERDRGKIESLWEMSVYVLGRRNSVSLWEPGVCGSLLISMLVSDDRHVFDQSVISEVCRQEEFRSNALCSHSPLNHSPSACT